MNKFEALKRYFGYDAFREGQEKLVDAILAGRDTYADGRGKVAVFSAPGTDVGRHYAGGFTVDFLDEGSGQFVEPIGNSRRVFKQLPDRGAVPRCAGAGSERRV